MERTSPPLPFNARPLRELGLPTRFFNVLVRDFARTRRLAFAEAAETFRIGDLIAYPMECLLQMPGVGAQSVQTLYDLLAAHAHRLPTVEEARTASGPFLPYRQPAPAGWTERDWGVYQAVGVLGDFLRQVQERNRT